VVDLVDVSMKGLGVDRPIARLGVAWPGVQECYLALLPHKGKGKQDLAIRELTSPLREITYHMGSQCYLPPGRGDFPAFTPAEAGTRFSDPEGMQG